MISASSPYDQISFGPPVMPGPNGVAGERTPCSRKIG